MVDPRCLWPQSCVQYCFSFGHGALSYSHVQATIAGGIRKSASHHPGCGPKKPSRTQGREARYVYGRFASPGLMIGQKPHNLHYVMSLVYDQHVWRSCRRSLSKSLFRASSTESKEHNFVLRPIPHLQMRAAQTHLPLFRLNSATGHPPRGACFFGVCNGFAASLSSSSPPRLSSSAWQPI